MFYTIYKTTNILNGKFYIGKHKTKDPNDDYMGSGKLLKKAIDKHGVDNFHKEILHICKDEDHMNLLERILVVPDRETNYNLCEGGKGGWGYINSALLEEMRPKRIQNLQKVRTPEAIAKGTAHASSTMKNNHRLGKIRYDTFTGKSHTDEWKQKVSAVMKEKQSGSKNSQYGTCWITNGQSNRKIKREDLTTWLSEGYRQGRC